ncbi:MDR family oxidoreductase [Utexia brackfieldae]|uniref:acrylyl-CoA reductase (NADPH) n=1 Tax=Utexia brackfieldae TaxID=3074108 RepID=UPI00370D13F0
MTFHALLLTKSAQKSEPAKVEIATLNQQDLPQANVLIKVDYSSLNYKDALAITSRGPIARISPLVLGIDGVGQVVESEDNRYHVGDIVVLNGWGVGEQHWGCLSQYARLDSRWLIPKPMALSAWDTMAIGTAGYTAALCVMKLIHAGVMPTQGPILVTGASGGVGSFAIALLSQLGYQVTAATGKMAQSDYLMQLGAQHVIDRSTLSAAGKSLQKEQWAGAIDAVGSFTLANVCAQMQYQGVVVACGLAQGMDFPSTVAPFILRGVTLAGVDSVMASYQQRIEAWRLLAKYLNHTHLTQIAKTISLSQVLDTAQQMIAGEITGRFVVDVNQ